MNITDADWQGYLWQLKTLRNEIDSWEIELPLPAATKCVQSRHRTLGHLRACQEVWLEALTAFSEVEFPVLKLIHPWRRFDNEHFAALPWEEHKTRYLRDREEWLSLVSGPDVQRDRAGTINRNVQSIGSLTRRLVLHEEYHVSQHRTKS